MQNQSNPSANNGFTLMPMGAQQFYHMAQQHAMVNGSFAPVVPSYLPLSDSDAYSSMMTFGAYNMPQNMMPTQSALETSMYAPEMSLWGAGGFGYAPHLAASTSSATVAADASQWMDMRTPSPVPAAAPLSPIPTTPLPAVVPATRAGAGPADSGDAEHISDAPFADEHKWRKYGQKQVKRSPYPRNYYKCTISGCPAKKHLEKFWDNTANRERCRTVYIGEHVHPVAASPQVFATTQLDFQNNVLAQSAKIRSLHGTYGLTSEVDQQRLVVECGSQVDENEDGYLWRKYGQKAVKGSSTPRQYYRCRSINCPVKKTVEASPKGNTIVTYDGIHNHEAGLHSPHGSTECSSPASPVSPVSYTSRASSPSAMTAASYLMRFAPVHSSQQVHHHSADAGLVSAPMGGSSLPHEAHATMPHLKYDSNFISAPSYPVADSPSSSFSTTDEDESYLSEPSPKRSVKDEDVSLDEQYHQFAPDAPAPEPWYYPSAWDTAPELIPH